MHELRRQAERSARKSALAHARVSARRGQSRADAARRLGLRPETLRKWQEEWEADRLKLKPRGRPLPEIEPETRDAVLAVLSVLGPETGLLGLQDLFEGVRPSVLERILESFRERFGRGKRITIASLEWRTPGAVWSMDFTHAPSPIEGEYPHILAVRDLASGRQLEAMPAASQDAETVVDVLRSLFAVHGAPLVLKMDNGFRADAIRQLCEERGVLRLVSPPYTPTYNGSIEAGIGSLKVRAHYQAALHGHPEEWTCDDVEAARLQGNAVGNPSGASKPAPDAAWDARPGLTPGDRAALRESVTQERQLERARRGHDAAATLTEDELLSIDRAAIARALVTHKHLEFRSARIRRKHRRRARPELPAIRAACGLSDVKEALLDLATELGLAKPEHQRYDQPHEPEEKNPCGAPRHQSNRSPEARSQSSPEERVSPDVAKRLVGLAALLCVRVDFLLRRHDNQSLPPVFFTTDDRAQATEGIAAHFQDLAHSTEPIDRGKHQRSLLRSQQQPSVCQALVC